MTEPTDENPAGAGAKPPLFPLGKVVMTPGAMTALTESGADLAALLIRHQTGDWGNLDAHDREVNREALRNGARLLSAYELPNGQILWIITDADRSATTALTPEEY